MNDHEHNDDPHNPPGPELLQAYINATDDEDVPGVLVGCVVIAEMVGPSGQRWLTYRSVGADGEALPSWQVFGYLESARGAWTHVSETAEADE